MLKILVILSFLFAVESALCDTTIANLPLGSAAATNGADSVPYVNSIGNITQRLTLGDWANLPSLVATYVNQSTGNAPTATALAAAPTVCSGGQFALGIAANGNASCATPSGGGGSSGLIVSNITTSGTLSFGSPVDYQHIACDATGGPVVATIPACTGLLATKGQVFNIKKVDSSGNNCGVARSSSDVFDGQTSISLSLQYDDVTIVCRAAGFWDVI